jgi:adenylyl-sulfate kinase
MSRGIVVLLTGLSGAGKSTLATALGSHLHTLGIAVSILDGDVVRNDGAVKLGFTQSDRFLQLKRVTEVALEKASQGDVVICALIAPYHAHRAFMRSHISAMHPFFEIHISTPLSVCQKRDPKGLYAKASRGEITNMTGISDPYELPDAPDLVISTDSLSVTDARDIIFSCLSPVLTSKVVS